LGLRATGPEPGSGTVAARLAGSGVEAEVELGAVAEPDRTNDDVRQPFETVEQKSPIETIRVRQVWRSRGIGRPLIRAREQAPALWLIH
jgi:hypothetical protein